MQINDPMAYRACEELDLLDAWVEDGLLVLRERAVLELGCGAAHMTRVLAERFAPARLVATEVDRRQHEKNLAIDDLPGVTFRLGGAEAIADPGASYDVVFMLKSLHHVPVAAMGQALAEIHRVLRPGGLAYFNEPVYTGAFSELTRLIHDEREAREAAFETLRQAVDDGRFALVDEVFYESAGTYRDWDAFAERFLDVTHTDLAIDAPRRAEIQAAFLRHMTPTGAHFRKPHRIDLLRRL
jgi:SAM-dependent methyltransferase